MKIQPPTQAVDARGVSIGARTCVPVLILAMILIFIVALSLSGCAAHKVPQPQHPESVIFSGCVITQAVDGKNTCACMNPIVESVLDASTGRTHKVAYCGQAQ
jgi:hypothetical protein